MKDVQLSEILYEIMREVGLSDSEIKELGSNVIRRRSRKPIKVKEASRAKPIVPTGLPSVPTTSPKPKSSKPSTSTKSKTTSKPKSTTASKQTAKPKKTKSKSYDYHPRGGCGHGFGHCG